MPMEARIGLLGEGYKGRECRARYSQNWLLRVKSSALVTGFVLAEGTHQTRYLFRRISISKYRYIFDYRGEGPCRHHFAALRSV